MSEYIFSKFFSYTTNHNGSGSGSYGDDLVPCTECEFPPGTNIDTHYLDTTVLVDRDASEPESCCPAKSREETKPCSTCPLPSGISLDTHYIDTTVRVPIDAEDEFACCPYKNRDDVKPCINCGFPPGTSALTHRVNSSAVVSLDADGIYACCPVVPTSGQQYGCKYCPLPPSYNPDHWTIDTSQTFSKPDICCPAKPRHNPFGCIPPCDTENGYSCVDQECVFTGSGFCEPPCAEGYECISYGGPGVSACVPIEECDTPCGDCEECKNGSCVELPTYACIVCEQPNGSLYGSGESIDTHYVDTTVRSCSSGSCCPVVPRDNNKKTKTVHIEKGDVKLITFSNNEDSLIKTGGGDGIIKDIPPNPLKNIMCNDGTISITKPEILNGNSTQFSYTSDEAPILCKIIVSGNGVFNLPSSSSVACNVDSVQFGLDPDSFSGKINIGLSKLIIRNGGMRTADLRPLLISGRNNGTWDGPYGFVTNASVNSIKDIGYNFTDNGDIVIAWACAGDTDLDGFVDILDVSNILAGNKYDVDNSNPTWKDGDFNYDDQVDILDISFFLASDNYDSGTYLPQNKSFEISWKPPVKYFGSADKLTVSTTDITKPNPISVYDESYINGNTEYKAVCKALTQYECSIINGSIWTQTPVGSTSCNTGSCSTIVGPKPNIGSCCKPNGECLNIKDTPSMDAKEYCDRILNGLWNGYNTSCSDKSCATAGTVISDKLNSIIEIY
jgi:hypothetical protein